MANIHFLPDDKLFECPENITILKTAKENNIAHANACGGKGKCSTCRVLVLKGLENCNKPTEKEQKILDKLHAPAEMRLACQTTLSGDITLRRLVLNDEDIEFTSIMGKKDFGRLGESKTIAILFSDIRGFTSISEQLLPYDIVFLLNRYYSKMVNIIETNGGHIINYMGDGLMASFGINDEESFEIYAIKAAIEMLDAVDEMKPYIKTMYGHDFEIGIGIHLGEVVIGNIGAGKTSRLTLVGDAVNLASRIESANKEFNSSLLISEEHYKRVEEAVEVKDFVRTNLKGVKDRITLYEISGLKGAYAELQTEFVLEDNVRWYKCGEVPQLDEGAYKEIKIDDRNILLIKKLERIFAFEDKCPHMGLKLRGSKINDKGEIICKWHQTSFCVESGDVRNWCGNKIIQMMKNFEFAQNVINATEQTPLVVYKTKIDQGQLLVGITG